MSGLQSDNPLRSMGHVYFYGASSSCGHVEIIHLPLGHCIADTFIERRRV